MKFSLKHFSNNFERFDLDSVSKKNRKLKAEGIIVSSNNRKTLKNLQDMNILLMVVVLFD